MYRTFCTSHKFYGNYSAFCPSSFTSSLSAKAESLRADYDVTVLPQAKKLGKQFGTQEAAGYNAVAFADNDDVKPIFSRARAVTSISSTSALGEESPRMSMSHWTNSRRRPFCGRSAR